MSDPRDRRDDAATLSPDDAALVRRIAEHYRAPEPTPERRRAFRAALDARVARRARAPLWLAPAGAAAAVLLAAALWLGAPDPSERIASEDTETAEDVLLALAAPSAATGDTLPDDYEAIAGLFLDEV